MKEKFVGHIHLIESLSWSKHSNQVEDRAKAGVAGWSYRWNAQLSSLLKTGKVSEIRDFECYNWDHPRQPGMVVTEMVANVQVEKNIFHMVGSGEPLMGSKELTRCRLYFGLPRWLSGKASACNAGDPSLIPGSGRSPGEGNGNTLQYSCLENSMDRGVWPYSSWVCKRFGHDLATKSQKQQALL